MGGGGWVMVRERYADKPELNIVDKNVGYGSCLAGGGAQHRHEESAWIGEVGAL